MVYIGIDNGVTGAVGIVETERTNVFLFPTPVIRELSYTKKKQFVHHLDVPLFATILTIAENLAKGNTNHVLAVLERPMVNPERFKATLSAVTCFMQQYTVLRYRYIPFRYIDSKEWQREMLPSGLEKEQLKDASLDVAQRLFPVLNLGESTILTKQTADAILIAEYARRKQW
jgi:hypothetical protein